MPSDAPRAAGRAPLRLAGTYLVLIVLAALVLFPVYMTLVRALSTPVAHIDAGSPPYPVRPQWDVFSRALDDGDLIGAAGRSLVMTLIITGAQVATSCLAAYTFVFLRFPLKRVIFAVFMATLMIPIEVTIIANVQFVRQIGWNDSMQGLVAPFLGTSTCGPAPSSTPSASRRCRSPCNGWRPPTSRRPTSSWPARSWRDCRSSCCSSSSNATSCAASPPAR
jgi:ABC-type sugar transport system permease subunit